MGGRLRSAQGGNTPIIGIGGIGLAATTSTAGNSALMMPIQNQQNIPLTSQIHHQIAQGTHPASGTQHVIITNEPPAVTIDGDRAFAIRYNLNNLIFKYIICPNFSVAADLLCLPEHARAMARAQIQHLLENSKITIVKA
jgi:hypothetical protein